MAASNVIGMAPFILATQSGWGWESNKSCIARSTCLNVFGGSASSASVNQAPTARIVSNLSDGGTFLRVTH